LLPPIGKKKRRSRRRREAEPPPQQQQPAQAERHRDRGAAALLRRAARAARAEQQAERPDTGWLDSFTQMGVAIYSSNDELLVRGESNKITLRPPTMAPRRCGCQRRRADFKQETGADRAGFEQDAGRRSCRGCRAQRGDEDVGANGADFEPSDAHSIQSLIGSGREATMDIWRIILAIAQVAAAAKHEEVVFNRVESAPMARFHGIGQVFPDALYGHIVVTFDVALLRQEIKELQEGISYRRQRALPEHRGIYDVLEENLVRGNQELEDDMDFFTTSERKERTFGEGIAGVLGLWNVVQIHEVKRMVEGTKKGLMIEVHHVDALKTYAEATRNDLARLAERISQQTNFLWSKIEQISSKAAVGNALKPITAISKIATTITDHKLDRAVMDLVNVPKIFSEYAEQLEEEGWHIELDGWQDIFYLEANYHASAATLTVAVRIPLLRRESRGYELYKPTFFPIMHGSQLYDIRTDERIFAWEEATVSYLNLDDKALNRCIQAGNKYFCSEDKVIMQGSPQTCLAAVWLKHWEGIKLMCHLWLRPAILSARKINSTHTTHTVVTAHKTTEVRVQCQDSPKLVKNIRGQWWLAMGAGCRASTSSWEIVSKGKEAVKDKTVVVSVHTNVTAWTGKAFNFTLETPAPLQSVTSNIMQALREAVRAASWDAGGH
jgi:hypothetical protein